MGNLYAPTSERAKALHGEKPVELDLTAIEEADQIGAGHLEIVPRTYRVLSNNFAAGEQGSDVDLAMPVEQEAALIQGGHIERVGAKPAKKKG